MKKIAAIAALAALGCLPSYGQQQQNLSFWFDTPVSLQGRAIGMAVSQISGKEKTSPNRLEIPPEIPTKIGKHNPSL